MSPLLDEVFPMTQSNQGVSRRKVLCATAATALAGILDRTKGDGLVRAASAAPRAGDTSGYPKIGIYAAAFDKKGLEEDSRKLHNKGVSATYIDEDNCAAVTAAVLGCVAPPGMTIGTAWCVPWQHPTGLTIAAKALHGYCDERFILGVGMHMPAAEKYFGFTWSERHERLRDYMRAMRACFDEKPGQPVNYDGKYYPVKEFGGRQHVKPVPPLYMKIMEAEEMETAGETCDGLYLGQLTPYAFFDKVGAEAMKKGAARAGRDPSKIVINNMVTAVASDDGITAINRLKGWIANGLMKKSFDYQRLAIEAGFEKETRAIVERMEKDDKDGAAAAVGEEMWRAYGLAGTPEEVRAQAAAYAGRIDTLVCLACSHGLRDVGRTYVQEHYMMTDAVTG